MAVVVVVQPTIRVITKSAFFRRFSQAEITAIQSSTDADVVYFMDDYGYATSVDLDFDITINGLNRLVTIGLLSDQARADALLVDGTDTERYTG